MNDRKIRFANAVLIAVWLVIVIFCALNIKNFTVEEILDITPERLFFAALLMCALFLLKSMSIFVYSGILFTVNGLIFPVLPALLMDLVCSAVMVTAPFFFGKRLGSRAVSGIKAKYPSFRQLDRLGHDNEFFFVLILRSIHFLPSDVLSIFLGAAGFSYLPYLAAGVIGTFPTAAMYSLMGTGISQPGSPRFILSLVGEIAVIMFSFVGIVILKRKKDRLKISADTEKTE